MLRISWEEVKAKLILKFGDKLTYDNVNYINREVPIIVTCPLHGDFQTFTKYLFQRASTGCEKCKEIDFFNKKLDSKEKDINRLKSELLCRNDDYRSGVFEVIDLLPKSIVIIKTKYGIHNLYKGYLLSNGKANIQSSINKNEYIINMFKEVHGNLYDYSLVNYKNMKIKLKIICKTHGTFKQSADVHRRGVGCNQCGIDRTAIAKSGVFKYSLEEYLSDCRHNRDDFELTDYSMLTKPKMTSKGVFKCLKHNITYKQELLAHKNNIKSCKNCRQILYGEVLRGGYTEKSIKKQFPTTMGRFYFIRLEKGDEVLFKVGISRTELSKRFGEIKSKGYK